MFKVNNKNTRTMSLTLFQGLCCICLGLSGVFIVDFEHISHLFLVQVNVSWGTPLLTHFSPVFMYLETSHLICSLNQMTGLYAKCNIGLKLVNLLPFPTGIVLSGQIALVQPLKDFLRIFLKFIKSSRIYCTPSLLAAH